MANPKSLTRGDILRAAKALPWARKTAKWTVIVENQELPARPLVLEAAGVPPNDPTNSHQAVAILKSLGFETRYDARREAVTESKQKADAHDAADGLGTMAALFSTATDEISEKDWAKIPADLSKNVDHYLYGTKKRNK